MGYGFSDVMNAIISPVYPVISYSAAALKYMTPSKQEMVPQKAVKIPTELWRMLEANRHIIRLAGISGAIAVILGAYGSHALMSVLDENPDAKKIPIRQQEIFRTASQYHFYHTLALLASPFCRFPKLTASIVTAGMILFCGTCYYESITGSKEYRRFTPMGGSLLILSWITMIL